MHQVKLNRMPLLRTATGCRCRKTLLMMAMTRVRRSRGTPWRKIEFQTCELRIESSIPMMQFPLQGYEAFRIHPFTELFAINLSHVHDDVSFGVAGDGVPLQRARGRAFEVHTGDVIAGSVAGTFEFLIALQPVGDATQVRADRREGDE